MIANSKYCYFYRTNRKEKRECIRNEKPEPTQAKNLACKHFLLWEDGKYQEYLREVKHDIR